MQSKQVARGSEPHKDRSLSQSSAGAPRSELPELAIDVNERLKPEPHVPQYRPFIRWVARSIDLAILSWIAGVGLALSVPSVAQMERLLFGLLCFPIALILEGAVLAICGSTLGKWLLKITLTHNGQPLDFKVSLQRSAWSYVSGFWLGLPLLFLFGYNKQYKRLLAKRPTSYDERLDILVTHEEISRGRAIFTAIIWTLVTVVSLLLWIQSN